jgi:hypothetical protein
MIYSHRLLKWELPQGNEVRSLTGEEGISMANAPQQQEVVVQVPDIGLSDSQLQSLKEAFHNQLVTTMGGKSAAIERIVIVVVRVIRQV